MIAMVVVGPMIKRVDARYLILAGLLLSAYSLYMMSGFSLGMDEMLIIESGFIQGLGTGLMFVPLSTIAFATLESRFRNEGAAMRSEEHTSELQSLMRISYAVFCLKKKKCIKYEQQVQHYT